MRVLLTVASNKYTGAAAVAEACCRALLRAGVDAALLFNGGNNLEARLAGEPWALPRWRKERHPGHLAANLRVLRESAEGATHVVSHLPHDHTLTRLARLGGHPRRLRAFRCRRHTRPHLFHRWLVRGLDGALAAHQGILDALAGLTPPRLPRAVVPVPVGDGFRADIEPVGWRRRLGIPAEAPLLGQVGKLARGRGFDTFLQVVAGSRAEPWGVVVGHGEAEGELRELARRLGVAHRIRWTGYVDDELPSLYAALDLVLVTAAGSDHGHRAVSEAQACGRPPLCLALDGMEDLVSHGDDGLVVEGVEALTVAVTSLLHSPDEMRRLSRSAVATASERRLLPVGRRLREFLQEVVA